jgi:hypothetical protein
MQIRLRCARNVNEAARALSKATKLLRYMRNMLLDLL